MSRVLLIDDDLGTLEAWGGILRVAGFDVLIAECGREGVKLALKGEPDVILADLRLPDMSGVELLSQLRDQQLTVPVVLVTGFGTIQSAVDAIKLGAVDYVEKPLIGDEIVQAVKLGLSAHPPHRMERSAVDASDPEAHAASRWANAVVRMLNVPRDPKTIPGWGRAVGVSAGALKNWCRTAGLSSKRSLDFARLLRAVVRHNADGFRPEDSLDVVDRRTLRRLLSLGGSSGGPFGLPQQVEAFLERQVLIRDAMALSELRRTLNSL